MPDRETLRGKSAPRVSMGVNFDGSAWVTVGNAYWLCPVDHAGEHMAQCERRMPTRYRVAPREKKAEYLPADYDVELEHVGDGRLDHAEVRVLAHDAFLDAFGAR